MLNKITTKICFIFKKYYLKSILISYSTVNNCKYCYILFILIITK